MATWLPVTESEGVPPRVVDQGLEPDLVYARPPELVAWGSVDGAPWRIQAPVTAPGPAARWWDHGPVGPELDFMLGRDDAFGGGGVPTWLDDGTNLTASISFFGSDPSIVAWTGVVSRDVTRLEVRLDDGEMRAIDPHDGPAGFHRIFWFFPPRGATGVVVAIAADGTELQIERLVDVELHPRLNVGTAVNAFGHRDDRRRPDGRTTQMTTAPAKARITPRSSTSTKRRSPSTSCPRTAGLDIPTCPAAAGRDMSLRTCGSATSMSPASQIGVSRS